MAVEIQLVFLYKCTANQHYSIFILPSSYLFCIRILRSGTEMVTKMIGRTGVGAHCAVGRGVLAVAMRLEVIS